MNSPARRPDPDCLVYREVTQGDLRKLAATSNDTPSGGGARDLRFPVTVFRPVMERIFTTAKTVRGRQVRAATITYRDASGQVHTTELEYWPATPSRPREDRVARVHACPALGGSVPSTGRGRVFVVLTRYTTGDVRCDYAYEDDLRAQSGWPSLVCQVILGCLAKTDEKNAGRSAGLAPIQGYYDFINGTEFCYAE